MQVEQGSFPTSYIPTSGSTVTRARDLTSITGSNFSILSFNQTEGTFFATANRVDSGSGSMRIVSNQNATAGYIVLDSNNTVQCFDGSNASTAPANSPPSFVNAASVYDASTKQTAADGTLGSAVSRQGTFPLTPASELGIGAKTGNNVYTGHIKRLTYWPVRLSNSTLQSLTQ